MRAATGVPSVGVLWSAVASVRSGRRTGAPGHAQAVEGLRAGDLVDEVQVDVEQAVGHLVRPPRSCRTASVASSSSSVRRRRPPGRRPPRRPGFSKWWGRSASKVTQSPSLELVALAVADEHQPPCSTSAVSRLPGSCIGGSSAAPVAPPGASVWRESSARWPGWAAVSTSKRCPRRALPPRWRWDCADDRDRAALVEAQQLREPQLEAGRDARGDGQRRAGLAALDLREHRRADAAARGQVAQRQVGGLAQRPSRARRSRPGRAPPTPPRRHPGAPARPPPPQPLGRACAAPPDP